MQQAVTQQFIEKLRHNLSGEVHDALDVDGEITEREVLAAFDRAALTTILDGTSQAPTVDASAKFRERGKKAAASRKRNAEAKRKREAQDTTKEARTDGVSERVG